MIGPMLDLVVRAWRWLGENGRLREQRLPPLVIDVARVVPDGITVEEPTDEDRALYALAAKQRQQAPPGRIVVASAVSLYPTDRFDRCRQCERPLAMAGDWPAHVFVVCRECAHGMQHAEAMVENHAASEAHERAFRERRAVPAVVRRH